MPTALISYCLLLLLLLPLFYCCCYIAIATTKLLLLINYCEQELIPVAAELTTQLLRLISILWLPLCQINKLGNTTLEDCCDPLYLWVINAQYLCIPSSTSLLISTLFSFPWYVIPCEPVTSCKLIGWHFTERAQSISIRHMDGQITLLIHVSQPILSEHSMTPL